MATIKNLEFVRGANAEIVIAVSNTNGGVMDLTQYTANASIKRHDESANVVYFQSNLYSNGVMVLHLNAANTASFDNGRYVYKINITHAAANTTISIQRGLLVFKSYA